MCIRDRRWSSYGAAQSEEGVATRVPQAHSWFMPPSGPGTSATTKGAPYGSVSIASRPDGTVTGSGPGSSSSDQAWYGASGTAGSGLSGPVSGTPHAAHTNTTAPASTGPPTLPCPRSV